MNPVAAWQTFADQLANAIAPQMLAAGMDLWRGLSLIVIVWTGTQMALAGGGVNMASIVRMIVSLSIPLGMLQFYTQPLPWPGVTLTVPDVITGMGNWLHGVIVADAGEDMLAELHQMFQGMYDNLMLTPAMPGILNPLRMWASLMSAIFSGIFGLTLWVIMLCVMIVVYCVGLAQIVWAQLAVAIALLLGPVFIPFLVLPQLSFLFWGWFKTIVTYSLYAAIAAAVFRVSSQVAVGVLQGLSAPGPYLTPGGAGTLLQNFLMVLLFGVAALLGALQVGQFASMLLSGSGTASSGAGTRALQGARMAATKGVL